MLPKQVVTRCIGAALLLFVLLKSKNMVTLRGNKTTLLVGGAITGGLSGLAGSGGPVGAAVFLSLGLPPIAYIASEAATATAMHLLKTVIYSKLAGLDRQTLLLGLTMGAVMAAGTFTAKRWIKRLAPQQFERYVAFLLVIVGSWRLLRGAA